MQATDDPVVRNIIAQREAALNNCAVLGAQVAHLQAQIVELKRLLAESVEPPA
jgi:hypothetical protein